MQTIGASDYLHNGFGSRMWQGSSIGNPYNVVPTSQPMVDVDIYMYPDVSDPSPYAYPTHAIVSGSSYLTPVPPSGDRHTSVLRAGDCTLFESWHSAPNADGSWSVATGAVFNLLSNQLRPAGWSSADAAGFAILPALIRYDEVASGYIGHAVRLTAPGDAIRNTVVWPARHTDGTATGNAAPPMGTRFRLKASVDISSYPPHLRTILQGLKSYGMFLSDAGDSWQVDGAPDQRWDDVELQMLHAIHGSDFEAVDESGLMINPDSGQSR